MREKKQRVTAFDDKGFHLGTESLLKRASQRGSHGFGDVRGAFSQPTVDEHFVRLWNKVNSFYTSGHLMLWHTEMYHVSNM